MAVADGSFLMETNNSAVLGDSEKTDASNGVENGQQEEKKHKLATSDASLLDILTTFDKFELRSILSQSPEYKRVVLEGAYHDQPAVIILDKKPFAESSLNELLSRGSELSLILRNDIYGSYDCSPIKKEAGRLNIFVANAYSWAKA